LRSVGAILGSGGETRVRANRASAGHGGLPL